MKKRERRKAEVEASKDRESSEEPQTHTSSTSRRKGTRNKFWILSNVGLLMTLVFMLD